MKEKIRAYIRKILKEKLLLEIGDRVIEPNKLKCQQDEHIIQCTFSTKNDFEYLFIAEKNTENSTEIFIQPNTILSNITDKTNVFILNIGFSDKKSYFLKHNPFSEMTEREEPMLLISNVFFILDEYEKKLNPDIISFQSIPNFKGEKEKFTRKELYFEFINKQLKNYKIFENDTEKKVYLVNKQIIKET